MITDTRVLMLVCHQDDEALSAGGTLLQCDTPFLLYFNSVHPSIDYAQYHEEASAVHHMLKCNYRYSYYQAVNQLHTRAIKDHIKEIEQAINDYLPETIIIPFPSYNQDHRWIYDAALTAIRTHDKNWFVPNVLLAEQPETHTPAYQPFNPQYFVPIDIEAKLDLYHLYESQQRGHRSDKHIRAIATLRGMQCNQPFAEAFQVVRMMG